MEKTVCITGADHGLGFSLVKRFLEAGWKVFAGQYQKAQKGLAELAQLFPGRLLITELDVADDVSVKKAAAFIARHTPALDVLINNAAILGDTEAGLFDDIDFAEILRVFNVNAVGALRVTHSLAQLLMQSEEKLLVNISSEAGSI